VLTNVGVALWDVPPTPGETARRTFAAQGGNLVTHAFSSDGRFLAASNDQPSVLLWDSDTKEPPTKVVGGHTSYYRLLFSPSGRTLALAAPRSVSLWDMTTSQLVAEGVPWNAVAFGPNDVIASGGNDGTVQFWRGLLDVGTACGLVQNDVRIEDIRAYVPNHQEPVCHFSE
jgi:WD40 repeat protein